MGLREGATPWESGVNPTEGRPPGIHPGGIKGLEEERARGRRGRGGPFKGKDLARTEDNLAWGVNTKEDSG